MRRATGLGGSLALIFAAQVIANLQGLIALPIVIRGAGAAVYGAYVLLLNVLFVLLAVMDTAMTYGYKRRLVSAGATERRELLGPQVAAQLAALAAAAAIFLLGAPAFERLMFAGAAEFTPWLGVALLASYVAGTLVSSYFRYTGRFLALGIMGIAQPVVFVGALAVVAGLWGALTLDRLLELQILANTAPVAPFLVAMLREVGLPRLRLSLRALVEDTRVGLPLTLELISDLLLSFGDRYLICLFLSVAAVGQYQPAYQIASILIFLPRLSGNVLKPVLFGMIDAGDLAGAERLVATFLQIYLLVAIPFSAGALMTEPSLVALLTNADIARASRWVGPLVAVASIFYGATLLISLAAYVLARTGAILHASLAGAAANLGLNLVFLPLVGDLAVPAVTTLIGYAASCFYGSRVLRSLWRLRVSWIAVSRICLATAAMTALLWLAGYRPAAVSDAGAVHLAATVAAAVVGYVAALWAVGGLGRRELAEMMGALRGHPIGVGATEGSSTEPA